MINPMLKSKEVSTCLIIVKLYSCVYRTSADRTVPLTATSVSTHCLQNVACPHGTKAMFSRAAMRQQGRMKMQVGLLLSGLSVYHT